VVKSYQEKMALSFKSAFQISPTTILSPQRRPGWSCWTESSKKARVKLLNTA